MIIANIYMYIAHISNLQITIALMYCIKMLCKLIVQVQSVYRITLLCCERPHSERMVNATAIRHRRPHGERRPENGPCHCHKTWKTSRWQKDQKMVHATAIRHGRRHGDRKTRKWSMPLPYDTEDLMVTEWPENGPCHRHMTRKTSR